MSCVDLSASPLPGLLGGASGDPHDHLQYSDPSDGSDGVFDHVPLALVRSSPTGRPPRCLNIPSASSLDTPKNREGVNPDIPPTNASPESSPSDIICTVVPPATQPPYPSEDDYHPSGNPRPLASYPTNHRKRRGLDIPQPPCPTPNCGVGLEDTIHEYAIGSVAPNTVNTSMPVPETTPLPSYSESLVPPHLPRALTQPAPCSTSAALCLESTPPPPPPPPFCVCPPYVPEWQSSYPCLRHVAGPEDLTQARARITRTLSMVEHILGRTDFPRTMARSAHVPLVTRFLNNERHASGWSSRRSNPGQTLSRSSVPVSFSLGLEWGGYDRESGPSWSNWACGSASCQMATVMRTISTLVPSMSAGWRPRWKLYRITGSVG